MDAAESAGVPDGARRLEEMFFEGSPRTLGIGVKRDQGFWRPRELLDALPKREGVPVFTESSRFLGLRRAREDGREHAARRAGGRHEFREPPGARRAVGEGEQL